MQITFKLYEPVCMQRIINLITSLYPDDYKPFCIRTIQNINTPEIVQHRIQKDYEPVRTD